MESKSRSESEIELEAHAPQSEATNDDVIVAISTSTTNVHNTEEKCDLEASEKELQRSSGEVETDSGKSHLKIGTNNSVFTEVPRNKDPKPAACEKENSAFAAPVLTVPVKIISTNAAAQPASEEAEEPARLPEFVDWSARTTSLLYKKLELEVVRVRCEKQQLQERLDRSLQQTELDREVIKGLQQDLRLSREKVFECERQMRASRMNNTRVESDDAQNRTETSRAVRNAGDATAKFREQKMQLLQTENDIMKRRIDELDDLIRRNDRLMKSVQDENQDLRSRLEADYSRFSKFEERVRQLEEALTRANQDNLQLIDQMRSQLQQEQERRAQLEQLSAAAVRAPPTRKTLAENGAGRSNVVALQYSRLADAVRATLPSSSVLPSTSEREMTNSEKEPLETTNVASSSSLAMVNVVANTAAAGFSNGMQQSSQLTSLSSVSSFGLRRYLSLPPGARRQLASRFASRFADTNNNSVTDSGNATDTPRTTDSGVTSATNSSNLSLTRNFAANSTNAPWKSQSGKSELELPLSSFSRSSLACSTGQPGGTINGVTNGLPKASSLHYDGFSRTLASKSSTMQSAVSTGQLANLQSPASVVLASRKLPAVSAIVDPTAAQQANRLNLQEYREFLKERRRKLIERDTMHFAASELPAEAV